MNVNNTNYAMTKKEYDDLHGLMMQLKDIFPGATVVSIYASEDEKQEIVR